MSRVVVIDNYDSFTWNLVHLIAPLVSEIEVVRNDQTSALAILSARPDAIILSPGPCTPTEAGISLDVVAKCGREIPIFGVCLGLQTIGQALGGSIVRAPVPMHGKLSTIRHSGAAVFRGIDAPFEATRYHSLVIERKNCPSDLIVTADTEDGVIMAASHRSLPLHGVQFHPESIRSEHGDTIIRNFLELAAAWHASRSPAHH